MSKIKDFMNKPINTAAHYTAMAAAVGAGVATGHAGMALVTYGGVQGGFKLKQLYDESPHAGGREAHNALNEGQFGKK
jgi:acetoacetate decarboxylase